MSQRAVVLVAHMEHHMFFCFVNRNASNDNFTSALLRIVEILVFQVYTIQSCFPLWHRFILHTEGCCKHMGPDFLFWRHGLLKMTCSWKLWFHCSFLYDMQGVICVYLHVSLQQQGETLSVLQCLLHCNKFQCWEHLGTSFYWRNNDITDFTLLIFSHTNSLPPHQSFFP